MAVGYCMDVEECFEGSKEDIRKLIEKGWFVILRDPTILHAWAGLDIPPRKFRVDPEDPMKHKFLDEDDRNPVESHFPTFTRE